MPFQLLLPADRKIEPLVERVSTVSKVIKRLSLVHLDLPDDAPRSD